MVILTFDTTCINAKGKNRELNQLEAWQREGLIQIVSGTSVEEELLQADSEPFRTQRLQKFGTYDDVDAGYWVLGYSRLGKSTMVGDDSTAQEMEEIAHILFPKCPWQLLNKNQIRDVMVLHTHLTHKRDVFVTLNTKDFIGTKEMKGQLLNEKFGILVMTPQEAVAYVRDTIGLKQ